MSEKLQAKALAQDDLNGDLLSAWRRLQTSHEDFCSPFYCPEFARIVGQTRSDLNIGVIEDGNQVYGILPFNRSGLGVGRPVGGQTCDYQGLIGALPASMSVGEMLSGFGLSAYEYNHALVSQPVFVDNAFWFESSPRADLRDGYEAWATEVKQSTSALKNVERKKRKLARELGEIEFRAHDSSQEAWDLFFKWKNESLAQQGVKGGFGRTWFGGVLEDLRGFQTPEFSGAFSTLYAGGRLVAAHFGMRSPWAWHWWFPTYDPDLGKYSTGLILMHACIQAAAEDGLLELDFGRGGQRYKREFSNRRRSLCEGTLERPVTVAGGIRRLRKVAQHVSNKVLPERGKSLVLRGGNKVLRSTLLS